MNFAFVVAALALLTAHRVYSQQEDCPAIYERYCSNHSYCLPKNPSCEAVKTGVTPEEKEMILQLHNEYRNKIASGSQDGMPSAADMMQMEWDDELAKGSQIYAENCVNEHDLPQCRQVMDFTVGQNLAMSKWVGSDDPDYDPMPEYNWHMAIDHWYQEVRFFSKEDIFPHHKNPNPKEEWGHFTQMVWSESFRIGCGFALSSFVNENNVPGMIKLLVCEYGPEGNLFGARVYEEGDACSHCPLNTCCGETCEGDNPYPALCRRTGDLAPVYPPPSPHVWYCSFHEDEHECDRTMTGADKWTVQETLSGNYISIELQAGEKSSLRFNTPFEFSDPKGFCITTSYRKGPARDGDGYAAEPSLYVFYAENHAQGYRFPLKFQGASRMFSKYKLFVPWPNHAIGLELGFQVPDGKPDQYFEVDHILVTEGDC